MRFLIVTICCIAVSVLNAQPKTKHTAETEMLINNTHKVVEDNANWSHTFISFDADTRIMVVKETYTEAGRVITERFNSLPLKTLKSVKVDENPAFEDYGYTCECQLTFSEYYEVKVIFYQEGSEMENDNFYRFPFKEQDDCKRLKHLIKKLKRKA